MNDHPVPCKERDDFFCTPPDAGFTVTSLNYMKRLNYIFLFT
jgi:hypothetical protein